MPHDCKQLRNRPCTVYNVISRQKGRVGTWPARQAKTSIGTRSEGQEERFVQKEINQGEGPIELGQVHGEEEVVIFLSLIWIVVDYIYVLRRIIFVSFKVTHCSKLIIAAIACVMGSSHPEVLYFLVICTLARCTLS